MRKFVLISIVIIAIIFVIGAFALNGILKNNKNSGIAAANTTNEVIEDECTMNQDEYALLNDGTVSANSQEETISPNATLVMQKYYKGCGHTIKTSIPIPQELVNCTKEQVEAEYVGWDVISYSKDEVVIYKEYEGICDEHYYITDKDGYVAVYSLDENGNKTLKEVTSIATKYLTDYDLNRIKEGISVVGNDELNTTLEDFE